MSPEAELANREGPQIGRKPIGRKSDPPAVGRPRRHQLGVGIGRQTPERRGVEIVDEQIGRARLSYP